MFKGIKKSLRSQRKTCVSGLFQGKEREKYIWKTIGKPDDFTTKELKK